MFFNKKVPWTDKDWHNCQTKLSEFGIELANMKNNIKILNENLEKVEIKALEGQKVYRRKLQNLIGDEEKKSENDLKPSVFLSPNGAPI